LTTLPPITTARLRLRSLGRDDAELLQALTNVPAILDAIDFLRAPFTIGDAQRLIVGDGDGRDCFWGVWRPDEMAPIGAVGIHLRGDAELEIGYWFAAACRQQGLASEAVGAIVRQLADTFPARRIFAECRPDNIASWRLLERVGFRSDGRDGVRTGRERLVLRGGC